MHRLRLLMIAMATICVMALAVLAFVSRPAQEDPSDDLIITERVSLEVQCGKNHETDCLGTNDNRGKYKHKKSNAHITRIVVRDVANRNIIIFFQRFDADSPPQIELTYKEPAAQTDPSDDTLIIKGGSLEVQCGKNHGTDCLGTNDNKGTYRHKNRGHITRIVIRKVDYPNSIFFVQEHVPAARPEIEVTYTRTADKQLPRPPIEPVRPQVEPVSPPPVFPDAAATYDIDEFATFDALPKAAQEDWLTGRGPRLPKRYETYILEMRAFVQGGMPLVINYQLTSNTPAHLTVSVGNLEPFVVSLPAELTQQTVMLPDHFGQEPQVGKLRISALTRSGLPATFRLYGIATGRIGAQALNELISVPLNTKLAIASQSFGPVHSYEPLALFALSPPQSGSVIEIMVSPPTTIKTGVKPKQEIAFSFTPRSLFDNGRWELLKVNGLTETHVWHRMTGRIKPNKTLSEKWDGEIARLGKVSTGDHSLKVTAWRGDASRAFVIARAPVNLVVVK